MTDDLRDMKSSEQILWCFLYYLLKQEKKKNVTQSLSEIDED